MELAIVVAASENGVIGVNNTLPWRLSADLKHFKALTTGHPLIMGRKTYDSIGRPLPGRTTIVVTRQRDWSPGDVSEPVYVVHSLDEALERAREAAEQMGVNTAMLTGGAELYSQALSRVDVVYLTLVHTQMAGDAFFDVPESNSWREVSRVRHSADDKNEFDYSFMELRRI